MNGAGRERRDSVDSSLARTHAQSLAERECPRAHVPYRVGCELLSHDSAARCCAPLEAEALPRRLGL